MPKHKAKGKWYEIKAAKKGRTAEVLVFGDIGESWWEETVTAKNFVEEFQGIEADEITVRINSYGGSVSDGIAIYNAIRRHPASTVTSIDGVAYSIASLIAMAGDRVEMAENALLMIHAPWTFAAGNSEEMRKIADDLDTHARAMAPSYTSQSGQSEEEILELLTDGIDHYYTASEALDAGFIDEITGTMAAAATYRGNRYDRAGRVKSDGNGSLRAPSAPFPFLPDDAPAADQAHSSDATAVSNSVRPTKEDAMSKSKETAVDTVTATESAKPEAQIRAEAMAAEKSRRESVRAVFAPFLSKAGMQPVLDRCLDDPAIDADQARAAMCDHMGRGAAPAGADPVIETVMDSRDKFREGAAAAIASRMGVSNDDGRNEYRGMSLHEIARVAMQHVGVNMSGANKSEIASRVLAAHSTSDFPLLLADSANKALQNAYANFPSTWSMWCDTSEVPDFKSNSRIRLGSFNSLNTIQAGGEYEAGTVGEEAETIQAVTKGRFIMMTRQMIVNDDLGGFTRMAGMLGRAAARTVNKDVYTTLTANPTMSDAVALFAAGHNNLAGAGAAPSVSTLGAARSAMRKQTDVDANDYLNIQPRYALVPVVLEDTVRQIIASETDVSKSNSRAANPVRNMVEVISDPYLDADSLTAWYLAASPMDAPLMEVAFLDGMQTPYIADDEDFLTDAIRYKVRLDYGVAAIDWRGGYKNPGA